MTAGPLLTHRAVVSPNALDERAELSRAGWCDHFDEASLFLAQRLGVRERGASDLSLEILQRTTAGETVEIRSALDSQTRTVHHEAADPGGRLLALAKETWSTESEGRSAIDETQPVLLRRVFRRRHRGQAGHVNIQNFAQAIADAAQSQLGEPIEPLSLKIRFLRELHPGDPVSLYGVLARQDDATEFRGAIRRERDQNDACRWQGTWPEALPGDSPGPTRSGLIGVADAWEDLRGVEGEAISGFVETYRGTVEPRDVDRDEQLTQRGLWDLLTRALWGLQNRLDCHRSQLAGLKLSAAASTFDLDFKAPSRLGDPLVCRTALMGRGGTSLRLVHEVIDAQTEEVRCAARYVLTFFDPAAGRPVELPAQVVRRLDSLPPPVTTR